jgi:uncharacterized protein (TIGR00251 family)
MNSNTLQDSLIITETTDGIVFSVCVQPRASRNELCGISGNELKLRITSPPVEGSANKLCIEFLADFLGIAKTRVCILRGEKSRHKTIKAINVKKEEFFALLQKKMEF